MNANQPQPARVWIKHARTVHLPWSDGVSSDDKVIPSLSGFLGKQVVVTEKMDGESTSIYGDGTHARSLDSGHHPSRTRVKALQADLAGVIPSGWRIVGENVQAKHSIHYTALPSPLLVIAIFDETNTALSWSQTVIFCHAYGLKYVPVLYQGVWDERAAKACWTGISRFGGDQEGYVVRVAEAIPYGEWGTKVAKYVRANHVQHDAEHWSKAEMVPNGITGNQG
jgi:hypothetical protein